MNTNLSSGKLLLKNSLINIVGQVIPLLVALFSIPLIIRYLGEERFGILTLAWILVGYFSFFDFGLGRALTKFVADLLGSNEKAKIPSIVWSSIQIMTILGVIGAFVVALIVYFSLDLVLNIPDYIKSEAKIGFYLIAVCIPFVIITTGLRGVLEAYQRFDIINLIRVPMGIYNYVSPLLLFPFSRNLGYVVLILVAGRFFFFIWHFTYVVKIVPLRNAKKIKIKDLTPLLKMGGWVTVSNVISPLLVNIDRFFIGALLTVSAVAYYSTPYEFITKLLVVSVAIVGVLFPAFTVSNTGDTRKMHLLYINGMKYIIIFMFPAILFFVLFSSDVLMIWLGSDFSNESSLVLVLLSIGVFINSLANVPSVMLQAIGRADLNAKFHLLELPLYVILLFISLKLFGINGVAFTWMVRTWIDFLLLFIAVYKKIGINFSQFKTIITLFVYSIVSFISFIFIKTLLLKLTFFIILNAIFFLIVWFRGLDQSEKQIVIKLLQRRKKDADVSPS